MASCEKKYTILLLSAPIGSGHKLAAQALEQSFALAENVCVVHGSVFDFFPGSIGKAFLSFYLWVLSYCPWLYELAYKWGNRQSGSLWLRNLINSILAGLAQDFLTRTNPDAVIATHATPAGIMAIYKKKFKPDLLLGAVVTDYTVHKWWLCEGVDVYFAASENLRAQFDGIDAEVLPTGIPVRRQFYQAYDRQELRRKSVRRKLNANRAEFRDKNVLLVDDSIVRGTTSEQIIEMAREAGAKKVYLASAAPEIRFPNVYGIDMPTANELIAHGREVDEIRQIIGADGLIFQDLNDLIDAVRAENPDIQQFECSVFNGVYVTRDVDQQYLDYLDSLRNDDAKAVQLQNEVENLEMHNEG